jgi:hypothetical protein
LGYVQQEFLHRAKMHPKLISTLKNFLRIQFHIFNYARHLFTVARFLALRLAHKSEFSLKKPVTISLRRSLAPSLAQQKFLPKRLYPAFNV